MAAAPPAPISDTGDNIGHKCNGNNNNNNRENSQMNCAENLQDSFFLFQRVCDVSYFISPQRSGRIMLQLHSFYCFVFSGPLGAGRVCG